MNEAVETRLHKEQLGHDSASRTGRSRNGCSGRVSASDEPPVSGGLSHPDGGHRRQPGLNSEAIIAIPGFPFAGSTGAAQSSRAAPASHSLRAPVVVRGVGGRLVYGSPGSGPAWSAPIAAAARSRRICSRAHSTGALCHLVGAAHHPRAASRGTPSRAEVGVVQGRVSRMIPVTHS